MREHDIAATAPFALAAMILASVGVRLWLAWRVPTPWIMVDELIYSEMAKSFAAGGHFLIRGSPAGISAVGYPFLISTGWLFGPVAAAYGIAKAFNAALVSLTAIPIYFWAARLVGKRWLALVASALVLMMPALLYSGMLMTENAFLPTFVLAVWAIAVALERPTLLWPRSASSVYSEFRGSCCCSCCRRRSCSSWSSTFEPNGRCVGGGPF